MTTDGVRLVFSAVEADVARELEPRCAANVPVISTASAFRYEPDVPVFLPGVNWDHAALIDVQRKKRGWKGFVVAGPELHHGRPRDHAASRSTTRSACRA